MNRSYSRISAAVLAAGMILIPSCSKKEPAPVVSQIAPTAAATNAAATSETQNTEEKTLPAPVLAYTGQLETIAKAKSTWFAEGDAAMRYAVTDLDMNGRYEITAAKQNSFVMYEVTEDKSGLAKVEAPFEQGAPGPYIEEEYKLRMSKEGAYVYVARRRRHASKRCFWA